MSKHQTLQTSVIPVLALALLACGTPPDQLMGPVGEEPFGGRPIKFETYYATFPSDFSFRLVRDTHPFTREEACAGIKTYGDVPLPAKKAHYALFATVQQAKPGDTVTIDPENIGGAGMMRYAGIGEYQPGARMVSPGDFQLISKGIIRISTFKVKSVDGEDRIAGSYDLRFPTGESLAGEFDVPGCP